MKAFSDKLEIIIFSVVIIVVLFFIFRPTAIDRKNSVSINATVTRVGEGSQNNIIVGLERGDGTYYISHGIDNGVNIDSLRQEVLNKEVTILYLKSSFAAGFSPQANLRYITEVRIGNKIIYSEIE